MLEIKQDDNRCDGRVGFPHVRVVIALAGTELLFEERLTSG